MIKMKRNLSIPFLRGTNLFHCSLFWLALLVFLMNSSCSGGIQADPASLPAETVDESVDSACSYFYFLWGSSAEAEGRFEEALEAYEKALVCDEQADYINTKLALLLVNMGKKEQAIIQIEKMIAADPANLRNRNLLGSVYSSMGRTKEALKVYEDILQIEADDPHTLMLLGALYAREREYANARKILERLVEVDENSFIGFNYLAKLYRELRYYDKALVAYEKTLSLNWSPMLAYEAADLYEKRKNYQGAIAIYKRLLEDDAANTKVRGRLSHLYVEQGQIDEALDQLRTLRDYLEDGQAVDLAMGRILLDAEKYPEAIALFEGMLARGESVELSRSMLALSYYESGNVDKAGDILLNVPPASKEYEKSVLMYMQMLGDQNRNAEAVVLLRELIEHKIKRRPGFSFFLAGLLQEEGDAEGGIAVYEKAVLDFSDNYKIWFEYGLYLDHLGRVDEAIDKMEQAIAMNADDVYALNYVGYTWADRGVNLEKALAYTSRAVELKPEDGFIRDSLGWVYFKMGRSLESVAELEAAVDLQPDDPTINEHLGDAYRQAGEEDDAEDSYKKAMDLYEDDAKKDLVRAKIKALRD